MAPPPTPQATTAAGARSAMRRSRGQEEGLTISGSRWAGATRKVGARTTAMHFATLEQRKARPARRLGRLPPKPTQSSGRRRPPRAKLVGAKSGGFSRQERRPAVSNCTASPPKLHCTPGGEQRGLNFAPHDLSITALVGQLAARRKDGKPLPCAKPRLTAAPSGKGPHTLRDRQRSPPARPPPQVASCAPSSAQSSPSRSILPPQGAAAEHRAGSVPESARSYRCVRQ